MKQAEKMQKPPAGDDPATSSLQTWCKAVDPVQNSGNAGFATAPAAEPLPSDANSVSIVLSERAPRSPKNRSGIRGLDRRLWSLPKVQAIRPYRGPSVYFLTRYGQVVYVGKSCNVLLRIGQHVMAQKIDFDGAVFAPCAARTVDELESTLIRWLRPQFNIQTPRMETIQNRHAWAAQFVVDCSDEPTSAPEAAHA